MSIALGSQVQLKSGGPVMTVEDIADYSLDNSGVQSARCVWFDSKHQPCEKVFSLHVLELAHV